MKEKNKKKGFLGMLLGTLKACLLGNIFAGKRIASCSGNKKGKGIVRASYGKEWDF